MTKEEIQTEMKGLQDWELVEEGNVPQLKKVYTFNNFANALAFTNQVGALAEEEDHHPAILTEWGKVTLTWWTHSANGLSKNDFKMAAAMDKL